MKYKKAIKEFFLVTRSNSEDYCRGLLEEEYNLQAIVETSPVKWHLAHTSWFFETFILKVFEKDFKAYDASYEVLFNSYYNSIGQQHPRAERHLIARPSVAEVFKYRKNITQRICALLDSTKPAECSKIEFLLLLGVNHEQQHQELFFTDLLYNLHHNNSEKPYSKNTKLKANSSAYNTKQLSWINYKGGLIELGQAIKDKSFSFDNESPQHKFWLEPFQLSNRLVTNGEYLEFINDGGYKKSRLWLADGWTKINQENWQVPLYWKKVAGEWFEYSLQGLNKLALAKPLVHISAYEADAFARWREARLPTEQEWEYAANQMQAEKEEALSRKIKCSPSEAMDIDKLQQMFAEAWQWTSSAYHPYPGFKEEAGAIGEYNGKFMCNQLVLKGSSCVTASQHSRATYRNFFYPETRWQFSGIRLARSATI